MMAGLQLYLISILIIFGLDYLKCVSIRDRDKHLSEIITKLTTAGARLSLEDKISFKKLMLKPVGCHGIPFKQFVGSEENCEETLLENKFCFGACTSNNKNVSMCLPDKFTMIDVTLQCNGKRKGKVYQLVETCKCSSKQI